MVTQGQSPRATKVLWNFGSPEESMDSPGATMALFLNVTETEVSMPYLMTRGQSPRATRVL